MDEELYLREFRKLAGRLDIEIRYVDGGSSGLCTVRGARIFFLDRTLDKRTQLDIFVRDFRTLDLEGYFIVPALRRILGLEEGHGDWQAD